MNILNVHLARMWINSIHIKSSDFAKEVLFSNRGYLATVWKEFDNTEITLFSLLMSVERLTEFYKSIETSDLCSQIKKKSSLQSIALSD